MTIIELDDTTAAPSTRPGHPLGSLTAPEFEAIRDIVTAAPDFTETTRFAYVGLEEPHKREVLSWQAGDGLLPDRRARVMLLDMATGRSTDNIVSLAGAEILSTSVLDGSNGQLPVLLEEFEAIGDIVAADQRWVDALTARGTSVDQVVVVPLSAGYYDYPEEEGRRILRVLAFRQDYPGDHPWAHPVDGLSAYVDTASRTITRLIDAAELAIPAESGNFDDPVMQGEPLTSLKPIVISQPEGPSFEVDGEWVTWANWKFQVGFDTREGLVLRQLSFTDAGQERPIIYRASINEMLVPYGDPSPVRFWQNYFDTGEYLFGRFTNSLALGCDCVGEIKYFDAVLADELGNPFTIENGICMHEEDFGTLWKHGDMFTGSNEVRRQRRLVISFFTTVGNYDYGFYWYLYLDGTIECEAKLTGILFTSAHPGGDYEFASEVAPGLGAPYHQHLFSARLDMMVDGVSNAVDEVEAVRLPVGPGNEHGNAFTKKVTRLSTELESKRVADASVARAWHITNTEVGLQCTVGARRDSALRGISAAIMLLAMIDIAFGTALLAPIAWVGIMLVAGIGLGARARLAQNDPRAERHAHSMWLHHACALVVMAGLTAVMGMTAPRSGASHHAGVGGLLTAMVVAGALAFLGFTFWLIARLARPRRAVRSTIEAGSMGAMVGTMLLAGTM